MTDEARELLRGTHRNRILCHDPLPRDGFIDVCNLLMERGGEIRVLTEEELAEKTEALRDERRP